MDKSNLLTLIITIFLSALLIALEHLQLLRTSEEIWRQ